jgi:hypothetical protein
MTAVLGPKGLDVRQTTVGGATALVFRAALKNSSGTKVTSGTINLFLYAVMSDGSLRQFDFSTNAFLANQSSTPTTASVSMTHQQMGGSYNTGLWTYALTTLTGFTAGGVYIAQISDQSGSPTAMPVDQEREFQFGGQQGDQAVASTGNQSTDLVSVNGTGFVGPFVPALPLGIVVTGGTYPGTYLCQGTYGGMPLYVLNGACVLYYKVALAGWVISPTIGGAGATLGNNVPFGGWSDGGYSIAAAVSDATVQSDAAAAISAAGIPSAVWSFLCSAADVLGITTIGGWLRSAVNGILSTLSVAPIQLQNPIASSGKITIATGTDYPAGWALLFGVPSSFLNLTGSTPTLEITTLLGGVPVAVPVVTINGTLQTGSIVIRGTTYTTWLQFTPSAAQTALLTNWSPNAYVYRVQAIWTSPSPLTVEIVSATPLQAIW